MLKLAILTPVKHLEGFLDLLADTFECHYHPEVENWDLLESHFDSDLVLTNPNAAKLRFDHTFFSKFHSLKAIFTASTGTNHIDLILAHERGIEVYSLKNETSLINELTSTAELALAFSLMATRNILNSVESVKDGIWDYRPFIGRQFSQLTVGVIGFGRLGRMYANFCKALGARTVIFDPYVNRSDSHEFVEKLSDLAPICDVLSVHVHHTPETEYMLNAHFLNSCKPSVSIVNTARGEIVKESDMVAFLRRNSKAKYYADVLDKEIINRLSNPLLQAIDLQNQVVITPHIGGMTQDGQSKAYFYTAKRMLEIFGNYKGL